MGIAPSNLAAVSTSEDLRKKYFSKREGMLRTHVNTPSYFVSILFHMHMLVIHPVSMLYYPTFMGSNSCLD